MLALGYVAMAAAVATDLYLPAFPDIASDLGARPAVVQLTLTAFLGGAAVGQLFSGSLSDALGWKRVLVIAFTVFVIAAFLAAASPSIEVLIALRAVQGFAGASGAVLARAIIADIATPRETARAFGTLFAMMALGPAVANPLGAWLTELGGWRLALLGLGVITAGMLAVALWVIPESRPPAQRHPFKVRVLLRNLRSLARKLVFMAYVIAFGAGYAAMMVYIASSSFIVQGLFETTPVGYSLTFVVGSLSFMLGAWGSGRLGNRFTGAQLLRVGQLLQVGAGAVLLVLALVGLLAGAPGLWVWVPLIAVLNAGSGMVMSTASALAVAQAVGVVGAGSALVGFSQFVLGAMASPLGGIFGTGTAVPAAAAILTFALMSLGSGLVAARVAR